MLFELTCKNCGNKMEINELHFERQRDTENDISIHAYDNSIMIECWKCDNYLEIK